MSDNEVIEDSEEEELCNEVMDRFERQQAFQTQLLQQSGGGIDPQTPVGTFEFDLDPFVDRQSSRMGVRERHFTTRLRQTGNFLDSRHVVRALQDGLQRVVDRVLTTAPNLHDRGRLYFTLSSNHLTNNFQGWGLHAGEWRQGGVRLDALLNRLAQALNSNEQFEMDDLFQLSITQVHHPPQGTGKPSRLKPAHQNLQIFKQKKRCIIRIRNEDVLCCARALVTTKAKVDKHPKWRSIQEGRKLQREQALLLHEEAHVPFGPCGYEELTQFSAAPSLYEYQILLVDADRAFHVSSFGPPSPKQLILLHEKRHYDVITSLPGFFGTNYVCAHCFKPYNQKGGHCCKVELRCRACLQKECPDFLHAYPRGLKASQHCHASGRNFFGDTCFQTHRTKDNAGNTTDPTQSTICFTRHKCEGCLKLEVGFKNIQRHRCGYMDCPSCHQYVNTQSHHCFIQKAPTPKEIQELKKKCKRQRQGGPPAKRGADAGLQTLRANEEEEEQEVNEEELPPLQVFFDIEATQPQEQEANLIVAETEDDPQPFRFRGEHCMRDFLEWLDTLTLKDTRQVNVIAHTFQGYDGYFVVHQYHADNQKVDQLRNGCKLLEVKHDSICFIDSLSFFQMPLSAFPKTFGLTELRKGYFPHKFNIPENQEYVGSIPAQDYYMPETMSQVPQCATSLKSGTKSNETMTSCLISKKNWWNCESDVHLLKEGCLTFKHLFEAKTGFNPFEHVTIASACNQDLSMNRMIPNSIASEPVGGWRNRINQSQGAIEVVNLARSPTTSESLGSTQSRRPGSSRHDGSRLPGSSSSLPSPLHSTRRQCQ